MGVILMR
jgi:hypothetical protein